MNREQLLHHVLDQGESGAFEPWELFDEWASGTFADEEPGISPSREEMVPRIIELLERGLLDMYCAPHGSSESRLHEWQLMGPDRWQEALAADANWLHRGSGGGPVVMLALSKPAQPYVADLDFKRDWLSKLERRWPRRSIVEPEPGVR